MAGPMFGFVSVSPRTSKARLSGQRVPADSVELPCSRMKLLSFLQLRYQRYTCCQAVLKRIIHRPPGGGCRDNYLQKNPGLERGKVRKGKPPPHEPAGYEYWYGNALANFIGASLLIATGAVFLAVTTSKFL